MLFRSDIEGKSTAEQLSWIKKWNAEHPDARIPEDVSGIAILRQWAGTGAPAAGAPAGTTTTGGTGTAAQPAANPTMEKAKEVGRTKIVEKAGEIYANSADIITKIKGYDKSLEWLDNQQTNFGGLFSEGILPGERFAGKVIGSDDFEHTQAIMRDIKAIQSTAAKMLGINPTDRDLQFVVDNSPDESWTNKAVANYIRRYREAAQRTLEIAKKQLDSGDRKSTRLNSSH